MRSFATHFAHLDILADFDADWAQVAHSRKQILDVAIEQKPLITGVHIDLPDVGYVAKSDKLIAGL